jgi:CHAD domain-containing protein
MEGVENEVKLQAGADFTVPDLSGLADVSSLDEPAIFELRADYYDTPDLRLARDGITLRRRVGGSDDGWHLKLPLPTRKPETDAIVRDELHVPLTASDEPPARFLELVTAWRRRAPVGLAATLLTRRTVHVVRDSAGQPLAEVTDDLVTIQDAPGRGGFREIEVEHRGGDSRVLDAAREALLAHGAVPTEPIPKLVRALGAAAAVAPDVPVPAEVGPHDPAAALVAATLQAHTRALIHQDPRVRRHQADAVHQMRVSARRLRASLRTFRPLVDLEWARSLRQELAWLGTSLGAARDAEVLEMRLLAALDELPGDLVIGDARKRITATLGGEVGASVAEAEATLASDRYVELLDRLVDASSTPLTVPAAQKRCEASVPPLLDVSWRRLMKRADRACLPQSNDHELHLTRIAAKQARYAAEAAVPVFGRPAKRLAAIAEEVQELLGEQHDSVVAAETTLRLAGSPRVGQAAFTFGVLHEHEVAAASRARDSFVHMWPRAKRRARRGLLSL